MSEKENKPEDLDIQIKEIEIDLVNFLVDGLVNFSGRDPIYAKIITYFFTRQTLTQKKLRELTGLSAGAISQTLKRFEEMGIITTTYKEDKYGKEYTMDGITFGKSEYLMHIEGKYQDLTRKLESLNSKIDQNREKLKEIHGYEKVNALIPEILMILKILPMRLKIFEQDLAELLKKDN